MKIRKLVTCAMLIALCFVGSNIKIFGSIAFDSMAAFLGALLLGPWYGAVLGAGGHFLTALTSGFPLTVPVHIITMFSMALTMFFFNIVQINLEKKINIWAARAGGIITALIFNVGIGLLLTTPLLGFGAFAYAPPLLAGTLANVVIAEAVYVFLPKQIKERFLLK
ncbi:ECF transporter S component [Candidatus Clostridium stratigraminis]|uniref:ECF transporter S component n=1 Tax=Candidatus Clostridium stratigraminis TaxID=3381661 RepID=A0ABW8T3U6_9CLOT